MKTIFASVDIGSNSFRLYVAQVSKNKNNPHLKPIKILKKLKKTARLGSGLDKNMHLTAESIQNSCQILQEFADLLKEYPIQKVRVVATNTLRIAKNQEQFLSAAEKALGYPIEVISGSEEARLIYLGVHHAVQADQYQKIVVDIGGGSTEIIIGLNEEIKCLISLPIGCLSFSQQFFKDNTVTAEAMQQAEDHAKYHLAPILNRYRHIGWDKAFGSSGTSKALAAILLAEQYESQGITLKGLNALKHRLIQTGSVENAQLKGIKPDRVAVLPGGLAIMIAIHESLQMTNMQASDGALRLGVLYDLLDREAQSNIREQTVQNLMRRFHIDTIHATEIKSTVKQIYRQIEPSYHLEENDFKLLLWATQLYEIGQSINPSDFKKHSHYIIQHAEMLGFSEQEKAMIAQIIEGAIGDQGFETPPTLQQVIATFCLRFANLFCRNRQYNNKVPLQIIAFAERHMQLKLNQRWLEKNPITAKAFFEEVLFWQPYLSITTVQD